MKKAGEARRYRRHPEIEARAVRQRRGAFRQYVPILFGGALLIPAFAFAGYYMGQSAVAHNAGPEDSIASVNTPATTIISKGSLLPAASFDIVNATVLHKQVVVTIGKADVVDDDPGEEIKIIPAAVNLQDPPEAPVKRLVLAPTPDKIEKTFKLKRGEKQKVTAARRLRQAEENCLARAIYFEARSESELGQLAVAKVILNRTKDPDYPKSICGVVYQGSGRRNSCQFSFACDGLPDDVKSAAAWNRSKKVALMAIQGDHKVRAIGSATNYHADYVKPKWAKNMKRLIKIGHHIFYSDT